MAKNYEGKIGIGQLFFCIIAAATLFIPITFDPEMTFAYKTLLPVAEGDATFIQLLYLGNVFSAFSIPELPTIVNQLIPYAVYAFYAVVAYDFVFILLLMIIRVDGLRKLFRFFGILLGFVMLAAFIVSLATVVGFVLAYIGGAFGDGVGIIDSAKNGGALFFLGVTIMSLVGTIKQFSSFFGRSI